MSQDDRRAGASGITRIPRGRASVRVASTPVRDGPGRGRATWPTTGSVGRGLPGRPAGQARPGRGPGRYRQDGAGQVGGRLHGCPADPAAVLRGARRVKGPLRVELQKAAAADPGGKGERGRRAARPPDGSRSRRTSSPRSSSSPARCSRRSGPPSRWCCWSTRSTGVELETEALLLEILSEYQVSIPELGTVRASRSPWCS